MVRALDLADVLRAAGVPVVEVPGWQSRGAELSGIRGGVVHHTGTPQSSSGNYPTLGVVRDGRSGLPGPLSQLGLGRDGTWYVIASGRANHAGSVHAAYSGTHSNPWALGVEAEHPGGNAPWPAAQYASYVQGCAALARRYGITWLGHKEVAAPAGRKPDPNFDMATFRSALSARLVSNTKTTAGGHLPSVMTGSLSPLERTNQEADVKILKTDKGNYYRVGETTFVQLYTAAQVVSAQKVWPTVDVTEGDAQEELRRVQNATAYLRKATAGLTDLDVERIRDDAVVAGLELSKGHVRGSVIHLQRGTTPPPA